MYKKSSVSISVGTSSILVIFVILCLTTFSALSLISAKADYALSQKAQIAADNYWQAHNTAAQTLKDIDSVLTQAISKAVSYEEYERYALELLALNKNLSSVDFTPAQNNTAKLQFCVPIDASQELLVELGLSFSPGRYKVISWRSRNTVNWEEYETPIDLWNGELQPLFN